jgi:hypothetical protein
MLAISQSGATYNYLNWIPSESGPLVTHHGSIQKELENPDRIDEHYYEILDKIFLSVRDFQLQFEGISLLIWKNSLPFCDPKRFLKVRKEEFYQEELPSLLGKKFP